ncbi:hypothetical protein HD601_005194 [Jiangella mangrovi]|uniref:LVIVD repeat-containing protein n=1 Tax=Jiangella mangrovi TaxID=1524084 RepID=A0A7W9LNT7_9ACTN|nr:hypothetical protein [Jiangella mangrovi]MBB5790619.1 hypothetical protein [Jiangella mangrovi]
MAVAALVSGGLALTSIGTSAADDGELLRESQSEECANADAIAGAGDNFEENCLTESEVAEIEESVGAASILPAGETAGTSNLSLVSNLPKTGPFATTSALNSDLAFQGKYAFAGNYNGFTVYDIRNPRSPQAVTQVLCPGSQNDITVYGDLLFLSTDSPRTDNSCQSSGGSVANPAHWEGMKIFDISDVRNPRYISAVRTDCGSHTHTLVPGEDSVYIYVSSYGPNAAAAYCKPPHDKISIIDVPLDAPEDAAIVATPVLFPDAGNQGGNTAGCHDITAYPHLGLAAGACMGDGVVIDISDPVDPVVLDQVRDPNFAFWHSATFNNDGTSIIFTDELGGGSGPTCNPTVGPVRGANAIYTWDGDSLEFASYYKIPREQANTENCVAHNGSLIPVPGKDIFVQAWYQGGISVFDFTDPYNPTEFAWFDRGTFDATGTIAGAWSTYYYNGYIYSNEIQRGFDVFNLRDPRVAPAKGVRYDELNTQTQPEF